MNPWINRAAVFTLIFAAWAMAYDIGRDNAIAGHHQSCQQQLKP